MNAVANISKDTTRLYFADEAPRIGTGWRQVILTKDKSKVRIKDPRTGAAHSFSPKRWNELGVERRSAEYHARNSVDAAAKSEGIPTDAVAEAVSVAAGTKKLKQRTVKAEAAPDVAPVSVAAKPAPKQLSKDEQRKLADALVASSNIPVKKSPAVVAKGAKLQKSTEAAKAAAKPAKPSLPSVDAMKAAARKVADEKAAAKSAKAAAKQPKPKKPSALHAAKLLLIAKPSLTADEIVAAIAKQNNGLAITRVTASTVRSDFLHSCRALKEAGYLKDLDI